MNPARGPLMTKTDVFVGHFGPRLKRFEGALDKALPGPEESPERLHQAMRHASLGGGKRMRPLLVYSAAEALSLADAQVDSLAVAVEMIHAYSLVHDDLPAMDDDDLRRGNPTCHRAFDEATAILAGDALQARAFEVLAMDGGMAGSPEARMRMIRGLASACGSRGMAGGQAEDLQAVGQSLDRAALEAMHRKKTGALIRFCVVAPAWLRAADGPTRSALHRFGALIGLAFQIHDDILDETGETSELGKPADSDRQANKPTFTSILGLEASREKARELGRQALECLECFGPRGDSLARLARYTVERSR